MRIDGTIVVGIDATAASHDAAVFAWRLARRSRTSLHLVTVVGRESRNRWSGSGVTDAASEDLRRVRETIGELWTDPDSGDASDEYEVGITAGIRSGEPVEVLAELGEEAGLVVLGRHGVPGDTRPIGSVSATLPGHALCPVLVHSPSPSRGRIVVGFDTSDYSAVAALDALDLARDLGVGLTVAVALKGRRFEGELESGVHADLAWLRAQAPDVRIDLLTDPGEPEGFLAAASASADVLVLGKRGYGRFTSMLRQLGRTSEHLVSAAAGSVLVVPYHEDPRLGERPGREDVDPE